MSNTQKQLALAKAAKKSVNTADTEEKNRALFAMADSLEAAAADILAANRQDLEAAAGNIPESMTDRLLLDGKRICAMADGIRAVAALPDPVGEILETSTLPNGLEIVKKRVAMGVIGIIYESRPNVTSDAAALALKSGSAVVLRSGKDAFQSARAIVAALKTGLAQTRIDPDALQLIEDTGRESSYEMMRAKDYLDLLIPRGGAGLIRAVVENAVVPVMKRGRALSTFISTRTRIGTKRSVSCTTPKPAARPCATRWKCCWCMKTLLPTSCPSSNGCWFATV
ncbi:gamma-glutamyl phosphate reductase [Neisseria meningitidis]|nr:gamma-glutamyl phosphate reductase [Neisseria meningitidis]